MTVADTEPAAEALPVATLDDVLAAPDHDPVDLDVPEWGRRVRVRGFTRREAVQWSECEDVSESDALALQFGLVEPAVTVEQAREIVGSKSHAAVARVLREVMRLSGTGIQFQNQGAER